MARALPPTSTRVPPVQSQFAKEIAFEKRLAEAEAKLHEHPDRVPVVLEKGTKHCDIEFQRVKFLVPADTVMAMFLQSVRRRLKLKPEQALFVFVNETLPAMNKLVGQIYQEHAADDRFLYLTLHTEAAFGSP